MTQVSWHWLGNKSIVLDGKVYDIGYGNPGGVNDCLIDSLRQCLGLVSDNRMVRDDLVQHFGNDPDRLARVTDDSFLDVSSHWRILLQSLFKHNLCGASTQCDLQQFCVVSLRRDRMDDGAVLGDPNAPRRLVVMNDRNMHFDPCLPR